MSIDWTHQLLAQVDFHWEHQLRPRLAGLTDEEYLWEPVAGCWSVRPRDSATSAMAAGAADLVIDYAWPEPDPVPVTTIAWRLGHVVVGVLAMRNAGHFGAPAVDYASWEYAATAAGALHQLTEQLDVWRRGVAGLGEEDLAAACGPAEGPFAEEPMATLVLHVNRELIHHLAEVALLRDLYAHSTQRVE